MFKNMNIYVFAAAAAAAINVFDVVSHQQRFHKK